MLSKSNRTRPPDQISSHSHLALFDTPNQLPQVTTLDPFLLPTTAHAQASSRSSASNTPSLSYLTNNARRLPAHYGASCDNHVCRNHGVR